MRRILFFIVLLLTAATGARAESVTFYPAEVYEFYPLNTTFTTEKQGVWLTSQLGQWHGSEEPCFYLNLITSETRLFPMIVEAPEGYALTSVVLQTSTGLYGTPGGIWSNWRDELNNNHGDNVIHSGTTPGSTITVALTRARSSVEIYANSFIELSSITVNYAPAYTITYDANGGIDPPDSQLKLPDVALTLRGTGSYLTRTGYTCDGWATSPDGDKVYDLGGTYTANADATLYAHWNIVDYSITYHLNGGTLDTPNPTTYNIESAAITLNNPTKEGYVFVGWTGSNGTTPQTSVTIPTGSADNRYYTANWWMEEMELANAADNSSAIITAEASGMHNNVTLTDRTLYRDGDWNTLCLPFDLATLIGTPLEGFTVKTLTSSDFDNGTLTMNFSDDLTSIEAGVPYIVKNTPVIISSTADWDTFAQNVTNGTDSYKGKVVKLAADISVSTMAGAADYPFKGSFDGCGHTLTVNLTATSKKFCAPFRYLDGATIVNLIVAGNISTGSCIYCGSIVGDAKGVSTIKNCRSSVVISNGTPNNNNRNGGLVGFVASGSRVNISNCLFVGKMLTTSTAKGCGGIVGAGYYSLTITNSLYAPAAATGSETWVSSENSSTFCCEGGTVSNCYYTQTLGTAQGTSASGMSNDQLLAALGSGWQISGGKVVPKMDESADIHNPVFTDVLVSTVTASVSTDYVDFIGTYSPEVIYESGDKHSLYLGSGNTLYYPTREGFEVNSCRAYFQLKNGLTAGEPTSPSANVRAFVLNFGEGEETAIRTLSADSNDSAHGTGWYTTSGVKLQGKPTAKGLYIVNGKKVIIK